MSDPLPTAITVAAWVLVGGYLALWTVRNFRAILAVVMGAVIGNILALFAGVVVGFFFAMYHAHAGVPPNEGMAKMLHNPAFWLACTLAGFVFSYYTGFLTGLAAGSYEVFYAAVAVCIGGLMIPDLPAEVASGSGNYFWQCIGFVSLGLAIWGGYGAKRAKAAADETQRHGGAEINLGPRRI